MHSGRIERIVVTGDVLRTTDGNSDQLLNVRWLHGELAHHLHQLTGLQPEVMYRGNQPDDGRETVRAWYRLLGHAPFYEGWAATFAETRPPPALVEALRPDYAGALVVGWELSPLLRSVLDRLAVPWIDVELSPLRFLDDLALVLRCSWPADPGMAHPGLAGPDLVADAVARQRTLHRGDRAAAACRGAAIFLAQTWYDRTLIKDGRFFPADEAVERVAAALDGRRLIVKPHPRAPGNPLIGALQERLAASITDANVYALLAAAPADDMRFLTISSSSAIEACHFGHRPLVLNAMPHAGVAPFTSLNAHRSVAFWRGILAPILPLRAEAAFEEPFIPNRMRQALGAWGFTQPRSSAGAPAAAEDALASAA